MFSGAVTVKFAVVPLTFTVRSGESILMMSVGSTGSTNCAWAMAGARNEPAPRSAAVTAAVP